MNVRLVTLSYKDITAARVSGENKGDPVESNINRKELEIHKHFCVSLFAVAIKINSFTGLLHVLLRGQDLRGQK